MSLLYSQNIVNMSIPSSDAPLGLTPSLSMQMQVRLRFYSFWWLVRLDQHFTEAAVFQNFRVSLICPR